MPAKKPEIIIISRIKSPEKALSAGEVIAKVRGNIDYSLENIGGDKWKIVLNRGRMDDLLAIINSTRSVEVAKDSVIPPDIEVDVDTSEL